jgi:hypothetical protein
MKFRYVGEEYTEWFGFKWMTGTEHDVTDAHAIGKLSNSVLFEKVGGAETSMVSVVADKFTIEHPGETKRKGGRPRNADKPPQTED